MALAEALPPLLTGPRGTVGGIALQSLGNYAFWAGLAWLLGYVLFRRRWAARKIIPAYPAAADIRRELGWSLLTVVVYGLVGAGTLWLAKQGWTRLYWKLDAHGPLWFWATVAGAIVLHDTYFYWTHRLMHHPRLFRWFHRVHHESVNPSPWAAYCFSPLEAAVQAAIFPVVVCLLPIHPLAFAAFMVWQIVFNVVGHTGYEFYPSWLLDSWLGRFLNTPTNHIQHHESFRGNFSLYFNLWDRLMGTNHPEYAARFREVTTRPR